MLLVIKNRKNGHKKKHNSAFLVLPKKTGIHSTCFAKVGLGMCLKQNNKRALFLSKKKILYWRRHGVVVDTIVKNFKNV